MNNIINLLDEMCNKSKIKLKLIDNNKIEVYSNIQSKENLINKRILINGNI